MVDRTQEDIIQDRRIAALESKVEHLEEAVKGLDGGLRGVNVRIDRTAPPPPPPLDFWSFILQMFRK